MSERETDHGITPRIRRKSPEGLMKPEITRIGFRPEIFTHSQNFFIKMTSFHDKEFVGQHLTTYTDLLLQVGTQKVSVKSYKTQSRENKRWVGAKDIKP